MRLALEAAGAAYTDVARGAEASGFGLPASLRGMADKHLTQPPFAMPYLRDGAVVVAQTSAILHHLAPDLKLVAQDGRGLRHHHRAVAQVGHRKRRLGELLVEIGRAHV